MDLRKSPLFDTFRRQEAPSAKLRHCADPTVPVEELEVEFNKMRNVCYQERKGHEYPHTFIYP